MAGRLRAGGVHRRGRRVALGGRRQLAVVVVPAAVWLLVSTRFEQAEVDSGARSGVSSEAQAEIRRLKRENAELHRAKEILKTASAFFAVELDGLTPR